MTIHIGVESFGGCVMNVHASQDEQKITDKQMQWYLNNAPDPSHPEAIDQLSEAGKTYQIFEVETL